HQKNCVDGAGLSWFILKMWPAWFRNGRLPWPAANHSKPKSAFDGRMEKIDCCFTTRCRFVTNVGLSQNGSDLVSILRIENELKRGFGRRPKICSEAS